MSEASVRRVTSTAQRSEQAKRLGLNMRVKRSRGGGRAERVLLPPTSTHPRDCVKVETRDFGILKIRKHATCV